MPFAGLTTPLTARENVGYIGLGYWKVGRTGAWAIEKMRKRPGKIGILVENHRYRIQNMNESGFRSCVREHKQNFTLLEPNSTYESSAVAHGITERLMSEHPDRCAGSTARRIGRRCRPARPIG